MIEWHGNEHQMTRGRFVDVDHIRSDQLVAIEQIRQLKARYFRLLDTRRWAEWGAVFTPDAEMRMVDDTGDERGGTVRGREAIVDAVSTALAGARTVHHGHMPEIRILGPDRATGIWAMEDIVDWSTPGEPPSGIHGRGWYHEDYRRDDGAWRIESMVLRRLRVEPLT